MPQRHRAAYPAEFRKQIVDLAKAGRSPDDIAKDFEPSAQTIRSWIAQAERDSGARDDGLTTEERDELRRLRRLHVAWLARGLPRAPKTAASSRRRWPEGSLLRRERKITARHRTWPSTVNRQLRGP